MRIAIKLAYISWNFFGSQRQPDRRTVEGELLKALEKCVHIENFQSAGRTDKGVASLCMVFAFNCESLDQPKTSPGQTSAKHLPNLNQPRAKHPLNLGQLNHYLPKDMCCYAQAQTPPGFNPRHAKERHYRYFLPDGRKAAPYSSPWAKLDLKKMQAAAKLLEGTHDFSNFCKKSDRSPVRTIRKIAVSRTHIDFFAESFLWEQARRMSFFILQAGRSESAETTGAKPLSDPFLPKNPVPPLPPENLLLMNLRYPLKFQTDPKILSEFKSRMGALAERKRVEQKILTSFISL